MSEPITVTDLLLDAFDRVRQAVHGAVDGASAAQLAFRPTGPGGPGNSPAWLVWHLSRVQDDHVADAAGRPQVWAGGSWRERFALPFDADATGYGHRSEDVAAVQAPAELLTGYYDAVHAQTVDYVRSLTGADLARVVDEAWDPPVTLAVRLISVVDDDLEHAGQAALIRGLAQRH